MATGHKAARKKSTRKKTVRKKATRKKATAKTTPRKKATRKKATRAKPSGGRGAPPLEIDLERYRDCMRKHMTDVEAAAHLGVSQKTVQRRRKRSRRFREIEEVCHAEVRASLRSVLYDLAMRAADPDPPRGASTALIFLAKQPIERGGLGMSDSLRQHQAEEQYDRASAITDLSNDLDKLAARRAA